MLSQQENDLNNLYNRKARELASVLRKFRSTSGGSVWKGNKSIEAQLDKILEGMEVEYKDFLLTNLTAAQDLSNREIDDITKKYLVGVRIDTAKKESMLFRNTQALAAWRNVRVNGLDASGRVWNLSTQTKEQMTAFVASGIAEGRDAASLSRDIRGFLKEPDKRFRRVRDENGKLQLTAPGKDYHPGQGVYRSSYRNALRFTRNETNIAYRQAEYERRKTLDFVKGIKVNLSNAHPRYDICDELQGTYPKGFRFLGWHPQCLCFTTTVLMSEKEFINFVNTGKRTTSNIDAIPKRAQDYLNGVSERIKGWQNKPYFIRDNFKNTKGGFAVKKSVVA